MRRNKNAAARTLRAVMLGHAVGDALGVPVEFCGREELDAEPVVGMRGWGSYPVPEGCWSDDTSMAIATLDSLAGGIDYEDVMGNSRGGIHTATTLPRVLRLTWAVPAARR